ncbi:NBR1-Ig-like domain-containing protein [Massilia sp. Mn16-1_5]|uniref:NBR1-Ig-like domain-containing protein n=1 Tax=Massilia sp. Mn16-1_5 TaxID=2079199 RepID=UPI00109EA099|nr:NBR1-Ig-like domain-containing protein [Massilia sp. Mn16-1_5]THC44302.1 hypothetical protein C2862_10545 [Massilia sp. Mn16-1_5]
MMAVLRFAQAVQLSAKTYLVWVMLALLISWAAPVSDTYAQTVTDNATMMRAPPPPDEDAPPFNDARGVIQDVPRTMITNQVYDVWVMMKNTGTLEWNSWGNYRLGVIGGDYWGIGRVELPGIVPPDSSPTFRFQVRAPSTPGTYTFQWRMVQDGVEWFGVPSTAVTVTVRDPINNASYVSHYQTTEMQTGQRYDVSVTMYNNGESTWSRALEYTLMAQGPHNNTTWGFNRVPLPVAEVRPGESVTFTFPVTAPATAGAYISQWGMQRERYGSFGVSTNAVSVNVTAPYNDAQVVSVNVPARMQTRQSYNVAVTMRNSGTTTWAPGANYNLGSQNPHDNQIWGLGRVAVATPVAPGQQYTFNFPVTAPAPGDYTMQWGMVQDGVQWFGPGASSPVTVTEDLSRVTFIHTDGLGSPVARTDGNGNPVSQSRYEPYGYVASGATPTIGFTGHVNDADTGLTYMQQRYYDPVAGRFLSIDPVVTDANTGSSFNRYAYAINNPFKFIDPDGRKEEQREITPEDRRRAREEARKIYEETRITTQRCAEQTCTNSENAVAALQGIWSVFTGAGNSIRFVARGIGVLGPEEKKKWNEESKRVDDFVSRYRNDPAFKREVDQGARDVAGKVLTENSNGAGKAYISARAATGIITGLGPAAVIGDTVRAVEQGNGMAESLISGGILGE